MTNTITTENGQVSIDDVARLAEYLETTAGVDARLAIQIATELFVKLGEHIKGGKIKARAFAQNLIVRVSLPLRVTLLVPCATRSDKLIRVEVTARGDFEREGATIEWHIERHFL